MHEPASSRLVIWLTNNEDSLKPTRVIGFIDVQQFDSLWTDRKDCWVEGLLGARAVTATHGLCWCSVAGDGAGEPSDQRRTGISSTVGSNALPSAPMMGEASNPAPQGTASP